jgi:hypothetical protein
MPIKLLFIFIPFVLFSAEVVWDSRTNESISQDAYDDAIKEYVDMKYPEKVRAWREKEIRNNTITLNSLMWQDSQEAKNIQKDWQGAKEYCQGLKLAGFRDWRLPNLYELESIVDTNREPMVKKEFKNTTPDLYWSSSEIQSDSDYAWSVYFKHGYSYGYSKADKYHVRCVRAGQ